MGREVKKKFIFALVLIGTISSPFIVLQTLNIRVRNINNVRKCDQFGGADAGAKIQACINDLPAIYGGIADATGFNGVNNTISTQIIVSNKPITLKLHGLFTYTGPALSKGLIWVKGDLLNNPNSQGSRIECDGYPQNIALEKINNALPCGIIYTPVSGSGPAITLDENGGAINDVQINNLSLVVNSNVTHPINIAIAGGTNGGAGRLEFNNDVIINSATNQGYSGHGINMTCANAGAASGVQYEMHFNNVGIFNNGTAINSGTGGTTGDGIYLDPTAGTGCGFIGPVTIDKLLEEGLTGSYGVYVKGALNISITNSIINVNNLAASGNAVHVENSSFSPVLYLANSQFNDNNWSNNANVIDVSIPGGSGTLINNIFNGGTGSNSHGPHHAIDIGANVIGMMIQNNKITNMQNFGTVVNSGTQQIVYCGNNFSVGNGAAVEIQTFTASPNKGCLTISNGTNIVNRYINNAFGVRNWDSPSLLSDGTYNISVNSSPILTMDTTKATFAVSPIIPFNADGGANIPLMLDFGGTAQTGKVHFLRGVQSLNGGTPATGIVSLSGNAVYTNSTTYVCVASDNSGTQIAQVSNNSASQFVLTGNVNASTHQFNIICAGN